MSIVCFYLQNLNYRSKMDIENFRNVKYNLCGGQLKVSTAFGYSKLSYPNHYFLPLMVFIILHWLSIFLLFNLSGVGISDSQNILQLELVQFCLIVLWLVLDADMAFQHFTKIIQVQFGFICFMAGIGRRYAFQHFAKIILAQCSLNYHFIYSFLCRQYC